MHFLSTHVRTVYGANRKDHEATAHLEHRRELQLLDDTGELRQSRWRNYNDIIIMQLRLWLH